MDKQTETQPKLSRSLKSRHITMIAIGGAIGTGLFLGSGSAIRAAGPAIILTYLIVGIFCFFMMRALGELLLADPSKHSFIDSVNKGTTLFVRAHAIRFDRLCSSHRLSLLTSN